MIERVVCIPARKPSIPVHDPLNNGSCVKFGFDDIVLEEPVYVVFNGVPIVFNGMPVIFTKTMKGE